MKNHRTENILHTIPRVPDSEQSEEAKKESAAAQDKTAIDAAKEQVITLYKSSQAEGFDVAVHKDRIASLAGLNPEGVSQGIREIRGRVQAERDEEERRVWFEEFTRPGRGIVSQEAKEIDARLPERILWHKDDEHGGILMQGEQAILTGEGGTGKSRLALQWALQFRGKNVGDTGIGISPGKVVYMTYEDVPAEVRQRLVRLVGGENNLPDGLKVIDMMDNPLFLQPVGASENSMPCRSKQWREVWDIVREDNPSLVIIDPIAEAYRSAGYSVSGVRSFIAALRKEAQEGKFGILLLAHSTKAARSKEADPFDPGQVAGSASWTDAVRGVLSLRWTESEGGIHKAHLDWTESERGIHKVDLRCAKANYGGSRWTETLRSEKGGAWKVEETSIKTKKPNFKKPSVFSEDGTI